MKRWFPDYEDPNWETESRDYGEENPSGGVGIEAMQPSAQPGTTAGGERQANAAVASGKAINSLGLWWPRMVPRDA